MINALKSLLLVLGSQIPILGVAVAWGSGFLKNPLAAAAVTVAYELVVLVWVMLGKDVREQLKPEVVKATADEVKVNVLNALSDFRRRYKQHVEYEHHVFGTLGTLELEQVFVELQIAPSHAMQVSANPLFFKELPGSRPVWEFLRCFKKKDAAALAILGPPGCGKTTLMKHIALTFAVNQQHRYRLRASTPILLFLREHVEAIVEQSPSLAELTQAHFSNRKRYAELDPPANWFSRQLKAGRCLVLLDGLDEVSEERRQIISMWVEQQIRDYPGCRFVLTTRPQGYLDAPLSQAHVLEVLPFTPELVERFVRNWYVAAKITQAGKNDPGIHADAERDADDLLRQLKEQPELQGLTINPLLLTMIANVHNYRSALPQQRVELYEDICDRLLGHWQHAKGMEDRLSAKQKRGVLQPLAEEMMAESIRGMNTQEVLEIMEPHLADVGLAQEENAIFLKNLQEQSGLLLQNEADQWGFAHLTFQEYLCAAHWHQNGRPANWSSDDWQIFIASNWWHEVLRLYAAQTTDAAPLIRACMQADTTEALKLADNIAKEALKVEPALRENVTKTLIERTVIRLRSKSRVVSREDAEDVFKIDGNGRPLEYIQNAYKDQGEVVMDEATGLMWQKAGADDELTYQDAERYIQQLNKQRFARHIDWRLPTIPELMSLIEPEMQSNQLYLHSIFTTPNDKHYWCWSADKKQTKDKELLKSTWDVDFQSGGVLWLNFKDTFYVRGVRSRK